MDARQDYVHGYSGRERERLADQADTLAELLRSDTFYPPGSVVLEVGCGVGAQTVTLARRSPRPRSSRWTYPRTPWPLRRRAFDPPA